jgi:hypothetical protein
MCYSPSSVDKKSIKNQPSRVSTWNINVECSAKKYKRTLDFSKMLKFIKMLKYSKMLKLIRNPSKTEQFQSQNQDFLKDIAIFTGKSFEMRERENNFTLYRNTILGSLFNLRSFFNGKQKSRESKAREGGRRPSRAQGETNIALHLE